MSNPTEDMSLLLQKRTALIGEISKLNTAHFRNIQRINGFEILLMKDPDSTTALQDRANAEHNIEEYRVLIADMETELASLDDQVEGTSKNGNVIC